MHTDIRDAPRMACWLPVMHFDDREKRLTSFRWPLHFDHSHNSPFFPRQSMHLDITFWYPWMDVEARLALLNEQARVTTISAGGWVDA